MVATMNASRLEAWTWRASVPHELSAGTRDTRTTQTYHVDLLKRLYHNSLSTIRCGIDARSSGQPLSSAGLC